MGGVLHLWGPAASSPEGDAAALAAHAQGEGGPPDVVVTPSYWGEPRRRLLLRELERAGAADALVTSVDDELRGLEPPLTPRSVLVEVESGRIAVTELDFPAGPSRTRLTHAEGAPVDVVLDAAGLDPAGVPVPRRAAPPEVEFIVAAAPGHPLTADLRRRGHLVYPVPAELLGTSEVRLPAAAVMAPPIVRDDASPPGPPDSADAGDAVGAGDAGDAGGVVPPGDGPGDPGFDIDELRGRARALAGTRPRVSPWLPVGALAAGAVVAAVAVVLRFPGPDDATRAALDAAPAEAGTRAAAGEPALSTPASEPWDLPDPDAPEPVHRLAAAGASVELPRTWWLDDGAPPGALAAVDGGPMRILVVSGPASPGLDAAALAEGLAAGVAGDPALGSVEEAEVAGIDVVTHEERPGDGTVVLWHHRVIGDRQVSVGCQFRAPAVPHVRPTCDAAVRTVRPE